MSFEEPSDTQRSEHIYDLKGLAILTLQPQGLDAILLLLCMSPQYESEPSGPNLAKNGDLDLQILSSSKLTVCFYGSTYLCTGPHGPPPTKTDVLVLAGLGPVTLLVARALNP